MDKQVQRFYQKGLHANSKGNWLLALQHFKKCIKMDPSCAQAYYEIGMLYYKQNQHEIALEHMQQAVEHNTSNVQIHFALANIYLTSDQPERAIEIYHDIETFNEDPTPALYLNLGIAYGAIDDKARAIDYLEKSIAMAPHNIEALNSLGRVYYESNNFEKSRAIFQRVIRLNPNNPGGHQMLGFVYAQENHWEKAIHEWEQVLAMFPKREDMLHQIGRAWGKLDEHGKAISMLKKVIAVNPENIQARVDLSVMYLSSKHYDHAIQELKFAGRLDPSNQIIKQLLTDATRLKKLYG